MLELNGVKLAQNEGEFVDSLFNTGGTCAGYYRVNKRTITIMDINKVKVGIINHEGVLASATKQDNGKWWYTYGNPSLIGEYPDYAIYQQEMRVATNLIKGERR